MVREYSRTRIGRSGIHTSAEPMFPGAKAVCGSQHTLASTDLMHAP